MGCCLTKKSRDNRPGRNAVGRESLLNDDRLSQTRGVSLTRDASRDNYTFNQTASTSSYDTASIDGLGTYEPPSQRGGPDGSADDLSSRKVVGKSLMEIPDISQLDKRIWAYKRGHMVRNWRKRYIVIYDGEVLYFEKCDERTKAGINQKGKVMYMAHAPFGPLIVCAIVCELCGQVHLLGANCSMKLNEEDMPVLEIVGRHGEKDLLLRFDSMEVAQVRGTR